MSMRSRIRPHQVRKRPTGADTGIFVDGNALCHHSVVNLVDVACDFGTRRPDGKQATTFSDRLELRRLLDRRQRRDIVGAQKEHHLGVEPVEGWFSGAPSPDQENGNQQTYPNRLAKSSRCLSCTSDSTEKMARTENSNDRPAACRSLFISCSSWAWLVRIRTTCDQLKTQLTE